MKCRPRQGKNFKFYLILPHQSLLNRSNYDEDGKTMKKWENMKLPDNYIYIYIERYIKKEKKERYINFKFINFRTIYIVNIYTITH